MRLILSLTFFFVFNAVNAQYDPKALEILDAMSKKYQSMSAFKADFSYSLESPGSGVNETYSGNIIIQKEKFRLTMGSQEIINDGNVVYTYMKDANEVNISDYEPEEGEITPTEIYTIYKKGFKYTLIEEIKDGTGIYQVVDLVPEDKTKQFFKIRITVNKADRNVRSWKIFEKNGNRYTYEIKNLQANFPVTDASFKFDKSKYKGVQVVDLR